MPLRTPFRVQASNRSLVDLDTLRETLRYIESDVAAAPEFATLAKHIRAALVEVETHAAKPSRHETDAAPGAAIFLPVI